MDRYCQDLLAEYDDLAELVTPFGEREWALRTGFYNWTPWDEIAHLLYFDEAATFALNDPERFGRDARELLRRTTAGEQISVLAQQRYGELDGAELLSAWRVVYGNLVRQLARLDPNVRLPWYGPSMSARSFATARMMEVWAHGQDVWDVLYRRRPAKLRLRHVAHLGVKTFDWSFVNRGEPVPTPTPNVVLHGPGGASWEWGEPSLTDLVSGHAMEFCLVVTQRRHVRDTALDVVGDAARQWMDCAQCFAGPPASGPAPGQRVVFIP